MKNTEQEIEARRAVNKAVDFILSKLGTQSAEAMARILLHAYNHYDQKFDITDFCFLSPELQEAGFVILKARVNGIEPQTLASDKPAFDQVIEEYWKEQEPA